MPATVRLADERAVAAQAGAERQRPPQRHDALGPAQMRRHLLDQRDHRRDERDVVDDRREHRRTPEDGDRRRLQVPAGHRHELLRREAEHARDIDAVHDDEQAEEEDHDPVDLVEGLRHLGGTPSRRVTPASPARSAAPW